MREPPTGPEATGPPPHYFDQPRSELGVMLPRSCGRVLDLGCAGGRFGEWLLESGRATEVHGVELRPEVAERAARVLGHVWAGDLDQLELEHLTRPPYDLVVVADVLEHLRQPERLVRQIAGVLAPQGVVVASIPNVRDLRVLWPLLVRGRFEYADSGVLDRTHLRFFTRSSVTELLEGNGLVVETCVRAPTPWRRGWRHIVGRALGDLGAEQFLLRARRGQVA